MPVIRCTTTWEVTSGLPEDRIVNGWYFNGPNDPANLNDLAGDLAQFFNTATPHGFAVGEFLSDELDEMRVKAYDVTIAGGNHVPIIDEGPHGKPAASVGTALPTEVACCLSYRAIPASGTINARRRGRVFIGPLDEAATAETGDHRVVPHADFVTTLLEAGTRLKAAANFHGYTWVIYSTVDDDTNEVQQLWVDDAFDTQRRRGRRPSTRTLITL